VWVSLTPGRKSGEGAAVDHVIREETEARMKNRLSIGFGAEEGKIVRRCYERNYRREAQKISRHCFRGPLGKAQDGFRVRKPQKGKKRTAVV